MTTQDTEQKNRVWSFAFQVLAFCIGWGAALDSDHPFGAFIFNWALWALVFWFVGLLLSKSAKGRSSGEGPGSGSAGGGG